ncbi:uncharacterized protein BCR38DRAFT_409630 [Pseudomassariella vexata]|uniref:Uncharacterized protein n=1 Tax=Pseudomassariella vexata TaxID=1141098 RepID=A0A1Y2DYC8_9PEZI|nr:uncharacterized protein BCR38DRAFT_409630 [Pseudomassariella vexata]ORY64247.1 hypothetical protein BCR38DRAFT_409630 [Pseudomassariella vexata]
MFRTSAIVICCLSCDTTSFKHEERHGPHRRGWGYPDPLQSMPYYRGYYIRDVYFIQPEDSHQCYECLTKLYMIEPLQRLRDEIKAEEAKLIEKENKRKAAEENKDREQHRLEMSAILHSNEHEQNKNHQSRMSRLVSNVDALRLDPYSLRPSHLRRF